MWIVERICNFISKRYSGLLLITQFTKMASKVHRVRYYNPKPQPINCAALNKISKHLAIARGDASIEIWDVKHSPYPLKFIPGSEKGSVEALCWVNDRLLSTGLGGTLIEWDLDILCIKNSMLLTGHAAWCLDVTSDNVLAAVGTEQGYINLFTVEHDDIVYKKLFDKQEGRILCCKFNTTGSQLVTGSTHTIRVWDVKTGHAVSRMSVSRKGKEVIVWCLAFLSDNTVVSGDSLGRLTFWDSSIGEQMDSFSTHKADLTALAVTDNEDNIYCAGVDPLVIRFTKVQSNKDQSTNTKWARNVQMNMHEHDVRVLITHNEKLISAGTSGYLVFSSYPPKWVMRIPPMIMAPRTSVSAKQKLLLLRYSNHLEIWKLGTYAVNEKGLAVTNVSNESSSCSDDNPTQNRGKVDRDTSDDIYKNVNSDTKVSLTITEKPVKLISVQSKRKKQICCSEISPCGEFVFYSTDKDVRMLKLGVEDEQGNIFLSKMSVNGLRLPCHHVSFTADSQLMVAHSPGLLNVMQVDPAVGATLIQTINTNKYLTTQSLLHLKISKPSPNGATYLAAADTDGAVAVWKLNVKKFEHYVTMPKYQFVPSALSIDSENEVLYMIYVDQLIIEYQLDKKKFKEWPDAILPNQWLKRTDAVHTIMRHPTRNAVVFQDQNSLWIIEKEYESGPAPNKMTRQENSTTALKLPYNIIPVKYLAGFHWIDKDEALTIELLPANILAQLPAIVAQKKHV